MKIEGVVPALPTPFTSNGQLDEAGLARLVQHVLAGGVHALWVLGSTSEFLSMNRSERDRVVSICVHEGGGRVPVIVGVGDPDERALIKNSEQAQQAGAAACFATLPYYYILDAAESVSYLRRIASSVSLPFVFYDNPFSTNVRFDRSTMVAIASIPNLIAIKDSGGDFRRFVEVADALSGTNPDMLLQGFDQLVGPSFLLGAARGAIFALAAVQPVLFRQLYDAALAGDIATFRRLQHRVIRLCRLYEVSAPGTDGAFFAGVKAALEVLGVCGRRVVAPFDQMPCENMAEVEAILVESQEDELALRRG